MCEQLMSEHYTNLEYDKSNKKEVLTEILTLSKKMKFKDSDDSSTRFLKTASVIEKNLSLFNSVCEHVDIVTTILEYLTYFGTKFIFDNEFDNLDEEYNKEEIILSVILTIFNICKEPKVQLFLENAIIKNLILNKIQYKFLKNKLLNQTNEMILLKDSDLYAVINYLIRIGSSRINKIWVQVTIEQKFLSLIKKYFRKDFHIIKSIIHIFKSMEEFIPRTSYNMNIMSIWSEDIVYAKYLAVILNRDVIFVNTHMDLYGGVMLLPYIKIFDKIHKGFKSNFNDSIRVSTVTGVDLSHISDKDSMSIYNLFYDGKWHKPVNNMYFWKHNILWAIATNDDVKMCLNSAIEGFKTWRTLSTINRTDLLFQMITMLSKFSKNTSKLTMFSNFTRAWWSFCSVYNRCSVNNGLEIIQNRVPRGVIILKEKSEEILILRLIQILISGNSVIVIADKNSCSLAPYCDVFSTFKIPRGVINFLSNKNTKDIELSLCATSYVNYEKQLFTSNFEKMYINLTSSKQIVLSLK